MFDEILDTLEHRQRRGALHIDLDQVKVRDRANTEPLVAEAYNGRVVIEAEVSQSLVRSELGPLNRTAYLKFYRRRRARGEVR